MLRPYLLGCFPPFSTADSDFAIIQSSTCSVPKLAKSLDFFGGGAMGCHKKFPFFWCQVSQPITHRSPSTLWEVESIASDRMTWRQGELKLTEGTGNAVTD